MFDHQGALPASHVCMRRLAPMDNRAESSRKRIRDAKTYLRENSVALPIMGNVWHMRMDNMLTLT
jgi:hypothetical protein